MNKKCILLLALALTLCKSNHTSLFPLVISSTFAAEESSFRSALAAQQELVGEATPVKAASSVRVQDLSMRQSFIWTSIVLGVTLFFAVMALFNMDKGMQKDTILYAKFLRIDEGVRR